MLKSEAGDLTFQDLKQFEGFEIEAFIISYMFHTNTIAIDCNIINVLYKVYNAIVNIELSVISCLENIGIPSNILIY